MKVSRRKKATKQSDKTQSPPTSTVSDEPTRLPTWATAMPSPATLSLQTQLTVNQPGDEYEQEANQVASQVMRMPQPALQRRCACGGVAGADGECATCKAKRLGLQRQDDGAEEPELPVQTKPLRLQRQATEDNEDDEDNILQTKNVSGNVPSREAPASVHQALQSSGQPLDTSTRTFMEPRFGQDFSQVRVHTDSQAAQSAADVNAKAYTVGNDVVFGAGQYTPNTSDGQELIAHELNHTLQQSGSNNIAVHRLRDELRTMSITHAYAEAMSGVELQTEINDIQLVLDEAVETSVELETLQENLRVLRFEDRKRLYRRQLEQLEIEVGNQDLNILARNYSGDIQLEPTVLSVVATLPNTLNARRVQGMRVVATSQLSSGVETYLLRPGHGRGIIVSSIGGPSVMLDAGALTASGRSAVIDAVNTLIGAGLVGIPERILISHTDADHINVAGRLLEQQGWQGTAIEATRQQYENTVGQSDWTRARIHATPELVEVDVHGAVDMRQRVIGNMEITEIRLPEVARQQAEPNRTVGQQRQLKNPSVPVTVIRDMITGDTQVFTSDSPGRNFGTVVDIIGEGAYRQIIGGGAQNLTVVEDPHHGGRVSGRADITGFIRQLRLSFEASNGRVLIFAQTDQAFSGSASAHLRVLNESGVPVERVMEDPGGGAPSSVLRARGGEVEQLTISRGEIQQVLRMGRQFEVQIMQARQHQFRLEQLFARSQSFQDALSASSALREVTNSNEQIRTQMQTHIETYTQRMNTFWQALEQASLAEGGMRAGADLTAVRTAAEQLPTVLTEGATRGTRAEEVLERFERSIAAHEASVSTEVRLLQNAVELYNAVNEGRFRELPNLKAQQSRLIGEATRVLGARTVLEHVREAWRSTRADWGGPRFSRFAFAEGHASSIQRLRTTRYRVTLNMNLERSLELHNFVEQASHGMAGARSARGRVGAGALAAIELLRIGLEIAENIHAGIEAGEIEDQQRRARGYNMVNWWLERGVTPELALLDDDNDPIEPMPSQEAIYQILFNQYERDAPAFDRVVVTEVTKPDREQAVAQLTLSASTLDDWYRLVEDDSRSRERHGFSPFEKSRGRWYTLVWGTESEEYVGSFDQDIHDRLENLYSTLTINQSEMIALTVAGTRYTIRDSSWVGNADRIVTVINQYGNKQEIDFGDVRPRFVIAHSYIYVTRDGEKIVKAADAQTYARLRQYYWFSSRQTMPARTYYQPNTEGLAIVDEDDLVRVEQ